MALKDILGPVKKHPIIAAAVVVGGLTYGSCTARDGKLPGTNPACESFGTWVDGYKGIYPSAVVDQRALKRIANQIPFSVENFPITHRDVAPACRGIVPNQQGTDLAGTTELKTTIPPEGYLYMSAANARVETGNGDDLRLPYIPDNTYLMFFMGDKAKNGDVSVRLSEYVPGSVYTNMAVPTDSTRGVDSAWLAQQILFAGTPENVTGITAVFVEPNGATRYFSIDPNTYKWVSIDRSKLDKRASQ